jgi:hypothetical protein
MMWMFKVFCALFVVLMSLHQKNAIILAEKNDEGFDKVLHYPGDIRLVGFFPIHKSGHQGLNGSPCGEIQKEDGIQPLEAMLFTLDEINSKEDLLPGINLGALAVDSCDNPIHAADTALPLLKGFMRREVGFISEETKCGGNRSDQWDCDDNIVGVIGPQTSAVSLEIASLGRLFHIPLVSYLSTSVTLCQRDKFPNFFRTVPSDKHQAKVIVELLRQFHWNYASFVHSDSEYGTTGYQLVKQAVEKSKEICLADPITIYNRQFEKGDYIRVVKTLLYGENSHNKTELDHQAPVKPHVVIVFADRVPAGKLLQAAKDFGVNDQLLWIGSDAWASRESVVEDREEFVEGAIAIQPLRRMLPNYNEYFSNLMSGYNERNPWFQEYLEVYHNCSNDGKCKDNQKTPFRQPLYIHFVRDAVYAFAHALHNLHVDVCGSFQNRLCPEFKKRVFTDLRDYLSKVNFQDVEGKTFRFYGHNDSYSQGTSPHDGPPRYSVINFAKVPARGNLASSYDWTNVGTYYDGQIKDIDMGFFNSNAPRHSMKDCGRRKCLQHEIKIPETDDKCCWHCVPCGPFKYRITEYECRQCKMGEVSMENDTSINCVLIEAVSYNYFLLRPYS